MTTKDNDKLKAAGKIALGTARMAGGVATFFGYGLLGALLRSPGHMQACHRIGTMSFKGGMEMFQEGCRELKA